MPTTIAVLVMTIVLAVLLSDGAAQTRISLADLTLEELMAIEVTTASRTSETVGDAAARVEVVTAAQIERRGYTSLGDLLRDVPDFKVDIAGDPDYPTELVIQGSRGASNVVLLLDGIRISSPTNEPLPILANYPVHNARQVEIVYGPASAVYGADAFAAVINIVTKDADDAPGLSVSGSLGQYGLTSNTATFGHHFGNRVSLMVAGQIFVDRQPDLSRFYPQEFGGLSGQRTGTFQTIFGPMVSPRPLSPEYNIPTSAHSMHVGLSVGRLRLMLFESYSHVSTALPTNPDNAVYNADAFTGNHLLVMAGTYVRPLGRATSTTSITLSRQAVDPQSGYWNVYSNFDRSYKYAFGSMQKFDEHLTWKMPKAMVTLGGTIERFFSIPQGADLSAPITSQDRPGLILGTTLTDEFFKVRYYNTGGFGQLQYAWNPQVALTIGGRGDYNSRYGGTFNPRAGVVLQPTTATTVKLLFGTAFLAPSPYQSYSHYGSFQSADGQQTYTSEYWHLGNPELKPQQKRTLELSAQHTLPASLLVSGSAFVSQFTNNIKGVDADQSYAGTYLGWPVSYIDFPVNEGSSTIYGGTLDARFLRSFGSGRRIEARAGIAVADGDTLDEDDTSRLPIGGMAPWQLRFSTDVDWALWSFAPRVAVMSRQRLLALGQAAARTVRETLPGYTVVDMTVRRALSRKVGAFATVTNAFDRRYHTINGRAITNPEEFVGAPQNPRRLTVGVTLRFAP